MKKVNLPKKPLNVDTTRVRTLSPDEVVTVQGGMGVPSRGCITG
jgi:hypothetical protein